jgi:enoyl-CoA hydratase
VTIKELHQAFEELEKNPETRVIILTGSEKLVAGDIAEFADFSIEEGVQLAARTGHLIQFVENLKIPVIAALTDLRLEVIRASYGLSL